MIILNKKKVTNPQKRSFDTPFIDQHNRMDAPQNVCIELTQFSVVVREVGGVITSGKNALYLKQINHALTNQNNHVTEYMRNKCVKFTAQQLFRTVSALFVSQEHQFTPFSEWLEKRSKF